MLASAVVVLLFFTDFDFSVTESVIALTVTVF